MEGESIVSVLVPVAVAAPYTYRAPATCQAGDIVSVPLGTRDVTGVVWDDPPDQSVGHNRLRAINGVYDAPPLNAEIRRFVDWVADYTLTSRGMVLRMVLRAPGALEPEAPVPGVRLAGAPPERMTPARQRVLAMLRETAEAGSSPSWTRSGLAAAAGVSPGVVQGLVEAGTLAMVMMPARAIALPPDPDYGAPELSVEQTAAANHLRQAVAGLTYLPGTARGDRREAAVGGGYSVTLLDGVTGSGKTEVYFEAVAAAVKAGRQALVLLPEISLTADFLERFGLRFGTRPAEWHSQAVPRARERVWRGVADGSLQVVVGARSALFLPFSDLGLIVVDEEHDLAYKQEERAFYSARDMAVVRGHLAGFPVVLSSATPSIESRVNADAGRYTRIVLADRYRAAALPEVEAVDMRHDQPETGRFLSPPLVEAVGETLGQNEQALLFLNRRGYAPLTLCRTCGHRFQCPNCSTWLVEHRFRGVLLCHHCGHSERRPEACPACGDAESLVPIGPGVERLAEEVAARFPQARTIVLVQRSCRRHRPVAAGAGVDRQGRSGHRHRHPARRQGPQFPLPQAGRRGRCRSRPGARRYARRRAHVPAPEPGDRPGRAHGRRQPGAPADLRPRPSGDPRHRLGRPRGLLRQGDRRAPRGRTAALRPAGAIVVSGLERAETQGYAAAFRRAAPDDPAVSVLGPAEAPLAVVRGRHRWRLLVQAPRSANIQAYLRQWLAAAPRPRASLRVQVDIDPQSFL